MKLKRDENDCLTQCVAYALNIHPKNVPFFIGSKDWRRSVARYFRKLGLRIVPVKYDPKLLANQRKFYIVQGPSWRGRKSQFEHAVIYKGRRRHWDPNIDGRFLRGKPTWIWTVSDIKKKP